MTNPYAPGAGERPPALTGRDAELERVRVLLERLERRAPERSIVFKGLRGVGKTVLVNEARDRAEARGWAVAKLEVIRGRSLRAAIVQALYPALRRRTAGGMTDRVRRALGVFRAFSLRAAPDGSLTVGLDVEAASGRADSGDLEIDLTDLFDELGEALAERESGVLVAVDELQEAESAELAALIGALHEVSQRRRPVATIAAGLPSLPGILADARSYAERLFAYHEIGALDHLAATAALVEPAADLGVIWSDEATDVVLQRSRGYPFFLQAFGKSVWDHTADTPIARSDAETGVEIAQRQDLDIGFYGSRWERATPLERAYMRAMADVAGDDPASSGEVARHLGRQVTAVSPTRAQLIHKGLVFSPDHGYVAFTVPGMSEFIRRQHDE